MNRETTIAGVIVLLVALGWLVYRALGPRRAPVPGNANSETSPELEQAKELFLRGETVKAEELMREAVRKAEADFGKGSAQHATALNELAMILFNLGQFDQAAAMCREACSGPVPPDEQGRRDRLTFETNLGTILEAAGKLDEAEGVLRENVAGRREHYGPRHAGYAFGLEPLARLLLRMGKTDEAVTLADETVAIFRQQRHPRIASALVTRCEAYKAAGKSDPPFAGLEGQSNELIQEMAIEAINRHHEGDLRRLRDVVADLEPVVTKRLGEDHQVTLNLVTFQANLERDLGPQGDSKRRIAAARRVIAVYDRQSRAADALQTVLGLAMALSDAGQNDDAAAAYRDALGRAQKLNDPRLVSQVRRNYGLYLAELKRRDEASTELRAAVDDARKAGDNEMLGRSEIALAMFLQHGGGLEEARPLLEDGIRLLDPAEPDALCARSHLDAIVNRKSCGCGDMGTALATALREFVMSRLPKDTPLDRLDVTRKGEDLAIQVHLKRKPTQDELDHLNRVISHAQHEFSRRLAKSKQP